MAEFSRRHESYGAGIEIDMCALLDRGARSPEIAYLFV